MDSEDSVNAVLDAWLEADAEPEAVVSSSESQTTGQLLLVKQRRFHPNWNLVRSIEMSVLA